MNLYEGQEFQTLHRMQVVVLGKEKSAYAGAKGIIRHVTEYYVEFELGSYGWQRCEKQRLIEALTPGLPEAPCRECGKKFHKKTANSCYCSLKCRNTVKRRKWREREHAPRGPEMSPEMRALHRLAACSPWE